MYEPTNTNTNANANTNTNANANTNTNANANINTNANANINTKANNIFTNKPFGKITVTDNVANTIIKHEKHEQHEKHEKHEKQTSHPSQDEMTEILIAKIKNYKNIEIKTKPVTNHFGIFNAITIYIKLDDISNGVFQNAILKTVSYNGRMIRIKCLLANNKNLMRDMRINRDSIFQCFRDISPDTITEISLEAFKDEDDNERLRIIASTVKGSSIIFVYKKLIDFVKIINDKYGVLQTNTDTDTDNKQDIININFDNDNDNDNDNAYINALVELNKTDTKSTNKNNLVSSGVSGSGVNSSCVNSSCVSSNGVSSSGVNSSGVSSNGVSISSVSSSKIHIPIPLPLSKLDIEEIRLLNELNNIRLLKKAQFENQKTNGISNQINTTVLTFADKVKQQLTKTNIK